MKKYILLVFVLVLTVNAYGMENGAVNIHGFLSQGYLQSDKHNAWTAETEDGTFQFNEMGLNFGTRLTDQLRMGIQFFAKDLGEVGNDEVIVDWAFADYRYRSWLGVRVGKIKKPTGLYNQSRDIDAARAEIFLPSCIYNEKYRSAALTTKGLAFYGTLPAGFEYQLAYGVMDIPADSQSVVQATSPYGISVTDTSVENSGNVQLNWVTPIDGLMLSTTLVDYDFDANTSIGTYQFYGYHYYFGIEYIQNKITIASEYKGGKNKLKIAGNKVSDISEENYYVKAAYRFNDLFEVGTYYSVYYPNKDNKDGDLQASRGQVKALAWLKDIAIFTRFDINESWIVKLEGHFMDGLAGGIETIGDETGAHWFLGAAKVSYTF